MKITRYLCLCLVASIARADDVQPNVSAPEPIDVPRFDATKPTTDERIRAGLRSLEPASRAFDRGLMPFRDFVRNVDSVTGTLPSDVGRDVRMQSYRSAVRRLEAFEQPASIGWAADLAEARSLLAGAEDRPAEERRELAEQAIALRIADVAIGHARPADVAVAIENAIPSGDTAADREQREALASRARRAWRQQWRSGVGRRDELLVARANSLQPGDRLAVELTAEAMNAALEFHASGTASLYELATTYALFEQYSLALPAAERSAYEGRVLEFRDRLRVVADSMRDLRGRNAADLAFTRRVLADTPEELSPRPGVPYVETPSDPPRPPAPPVGDRVLEFPDGDG